MTLVEELKRQKRKSAFIVSSMIYPRHCSIFSLIELLTLFRTIYLHNLTSIRFCESLTQPAFECLSSTLLTSYAVSLSPPFLSNLETTDMRTGLCIRSFRQISQRRMGGCYIMTHSNLKSTHGILPTKSRPAPNTQMERLESASASEVAN